MADETIEDAKAALRRQAHAIRAAVPPDARQAAAHAVSNHLFDQLPLAPATVVAGYWPIRDELDCRLILTRLMESAHTVLLPVVQGPDEPLELRVWAPGAPLVPAGFGTMAPPENAPRAEPDMVLLPMLGFDRLGTRLGYGGGYYDRTLKRLARRPRLVGLAFAAQEFDAIPRAAHDVPLDVVVTETGLRQFGSLQ